MGGFNYKFGFLHIRAVSFQAKALVCFLPLFLVMMALVSPLEFSMPTIWHALHEAFERPASAFMLVNCVIATIVASSKLERDKRLSHEEESKREANIGQIVEMGYHEERTFVSENAQIVESDIEERGFVSKDASKQSHIDTPAIIRNDDVNEGETFIMSRCSLEKPINVNLNEKKRTRKARDAARRGKNKEGQLHLNKPLQSDRKEKKQLLRAGGFSVHGTGDPIRTPESQLAPESNFDTAADEISTQRVLAGDSVEGRLGTFKSDIAAPAAAHPSADEVWAAIMASKKTHDPMMPHIQAELKRHDKEPTYRDKISQLPAAAAPSTPTDQPWGPSAPAATVASPHKVAAVAAPILAAVTLSKTHDAAIVEKQHKDRANGLKERERERVEVNRKAEEFIERFNRQMRLQRQESVQRQRGRLPCRIYDIKLSSRGLLVG